MSSSQQPGTLRVSFLGSNQVSVLVEGPEEAAPDVLRRAAAAAGVTFNLDGIALVRDGQEVDPRTATVTPDTKRLSVAGQVGNG